MSIPYVMGNVGANGGPARFQLSVRDMGRSRPTGPVPRSPPGPRSSLIRVHPRIKDQEPNRPPGRPPPGPRRLGPRGRPARGRPGRSSLALLVNVAARLAARGQVPAGGQGRQDGGWP